MLKYFSALLIIFLSILMIIGIFIAIVILIAIVRSSKDYIKKQRKEEDK